MLLSVDLLREGFVSPVRVRLVIVSGSALGLARVERNLNLPCHLRGQRVFGGPNKTIIRRVQPYFKALHPLNANDYVLVAQVQNNKGAVKDPTSIDR